MKQHIIILAVLLAACSSPKKDVKTVPEATTPVAITSPATKGANLPYLTVGQNNSLYHSWVEKSEDTTLLKYAKYVDEAWTTPTTIAAGSDWFVNWADYPMISHTKNGLMAHFLAKSSTETYAYDVNLIADSGQGWSAPFKAHNDDSKIEHGFVTMLPLSDSTFQVAWLDGRNTGGSGHEEGNHGGGGAMTLRTAVIGLDGSITEESELDNRTCDCCQTSGAITSEGPVFVYRDRSELEVRDIFITRKLNGKWSNPAPIAHDNWNISGCPVNGPRADAISNNLAIAWYTAANNQSKVKVVFSKDAGKSFGEPITVDAQFPLGRVDLTMLNESTAIVSWLTKEGDFTLIKARKVFKNGTMDPPIVISETSDSRGSGFPQMEKVGDEVYFAWMALEGESTRIKMAKLIF